MTGATEDLRVVEVSRGLAGSTVGMMLADNGADVVRAEPPGGTPERDLPGFQVRNRGKRSLVADLTTTQGRTQLRQAVAGADALIWDLRPGIAERLGLTHDSLAADNPRLVTLAITGFGERGPLAGAHGSEGMVAAVSGRMADAVGHREGPVFTPVPVASFGAAMLGTVGLLAALHDRRSTGRGRRVHTSLLHALVSYDMISGHGHRIHREDPSGRIYGVMPLAFMTAPTRDERWIQMCSRQPHLYRNWMRVLGLEHLYEDPAFSDMPDLFPSQEALDSVRTQVETAMRSRTFDGWLDLFLQEDVGGDPFLSADEWLLHPQAQATGRTISLDDPVLGPIRQVGPLGVYSDTPSSLDRTAPPVGDASNTGWQPRTGPDTDSHTGAQGPAPRLPLEDVTILEVAYFYAAPWASSLLAELGARVIKIEPPTGDPARRNWTTAYDKETAGKESVVLDLKSDEGRRILHELVERADVFLHNFRPDVPERLGIDAETLLGINPRLLHVYGGCFGASGPWASRPGFHSSPNAITGSGVLEAGAGNPPQNRTYADPASALGTAAAIAIGLHARDLTGRGQALETTMLASMAMTTVDWSVRYDGQPDMPTVDAGQHGFHALHRLYRTADGWLYLEAADDRSFAQLADTLGDTALVTDERFASEQTRTEHDEALTELLTVALRSATADDWEQRLHAAGVPAVRADGIDHQHFMLHHPQMVANGLARDDDIPGVGVVRRSAGGVELSDVATRTGLPAPLGGRTRAILAELGYSEEERDELERRGVTAALGHRLDA